MELVNDSKLSIAWIAGKINHPSFSLTFIVKGSFQLIPGDMSIFMDESEPPGGDVYLDDDIDKSCLYESDFVPFKPGSDLLLNGTCYPPNGVEAEGCSVTFRVGDIEKRLFVFGDRFWARSSTGLFRISRPRPFTEMRLVYENSFGGPEHKNNPFGKGACKQISKIGEEVWPLPNIEDPAGLIIAADDQPNPAGYCPYGRMWPVRATAKVGTYDDAWLKELWPYFPTDFNFRFFNCASPDLQTNRYLNGDEPLYFENLHRNIPQYSSKLPGIRPRCFATEQVEDKIMFREVRLNLDTLHINSEEEKLNLVWRGVLDVKGDEFKEIESCLLVCEQLCDEPKSNDYYKNLLSSKRESDPEEELELKAEAQVFDDSWIAGVEEEFAQMDKEFLEMEAQVVEIESKLSKMLKEAGVDQKILTKAKIAAQNLTIKDALEEIVNRENILKQTDPELALKMPTSLTPEEIGKIAAEFHSEPVSELILFPEPLTRTVCEERIRLKQNFVDADLRNLDLRDLDFSNCDCSGADFSGACLKNAVFDFSDCCGALFTGCIFEKPRFRGTRLCDADFFGTDLGGADFSGAVLDDASFYCVQLDRAMFDNCTGFGVIFVEASLKYASFQRAKLHETDFESAHLEFANFQEASLDESSFEGVYAPYINMTSAEITGLHASEGAEFTDGMFKNTKGAGSIWEESVLERANFTGAFLQDSDFGKAKLISANFNGADLSLARFQQADLTHARMTAVNLFQGSLERAILTGTNLRGSNLYEVNFYLTDYREAFFQGANLKMTMLAEQE